MKIIVVGAGKVGYSVAKILSEEGHDITVIDRDPETITHLSNELDVICVEGSATNHETLLGAGAAEVFKPALTVGMGIEIQADVYHGKVCRLKAAQHGVTFTAVHMLAPL